MGDSIMLGSIGQQIDEYIRDDTLLKEPRTQEKSVENRLGLAFISRKILGHFIRKYGQDALYFFTSDISELYKKSFSNRTLQDVGYLLIFCSMLSSGRKGKFRLANINGKIAVTRMEESVEKNRKHS